MSLLVYISAPYGNADTLSEAQIEENVQRVIGVANQLISAGFLVYWPHCSHWLHMQFHRSHTDWIKYDIDWIDRCDIVLRLSGESKGSDMEVDYARSIEKPVFFSMKDFYLAEVNRGVADADRQY